MESLEQILKDISFDFIPILDASIPVQKYCPIDLSVNNKDLSTIDIGNPVICQDYINKVIEVNNALVTYGGYLEKRGLYGNNSNFSGTARDIHLGIDYWAAAGTGVMVPINGKVHSFKNNETKGDYGPTIILEHTIKGNTFYTLYGHLSIASLKGLYLGREFYQGEILGELGITAINVNYAPHLHFQIIKDIEEFSGDYPGVCAEKNIEYYTKNCPNPNFLLKL